MENLYFLLQKAIDLSKDDLLSDILQDLNAKVGNVCCMCGRNGTFSLLPLAVPPSPGFRLCPFNHSFSPRLAFPHPFTLANGPPPLCRTPFGAAHSLKHRLSRAFGCTGQLAASQSSGDYLPGCHMCAGPSSAAVVRLAGFGWKEREEERKKKEGGKMKERKKERKKGKKKKEKG